MQQKITRQTDSQRTILRLAHKLRSEHKKNRSMAMDLLATSSQLDKCDFRGPR